jgi:type II secretion system protein I
MIRTSRRRRDGFSLLEVLVAMVILTIGATSLIALFAAAAATHKRSVDRTKAAMIAEEILSEVKARYVPGIDLEELEASLHSGIEETIEGYRWSVLLVRPADELESSGGGTARTPGLSAGSKIAKPAAAPAKTAPKAKTTKRTAAGGKAEKKDTPAPQSPQWTEEELIVRVTVRWSQSGREQGESFQTLILPRPLPTTPATPKR